MFVCLFVWWCGARVQVGARLLGVESRQPTLASCRTVSSAIKSHNNLLLTTFVLQPNTNIIIYITVHTVVYSTRYHTFEHNTLSILYNWFYN